MTLLKENVSLRHRNTFGLEAVAPYWAEFASAGELPALFEELRRRDLPWYVLGGGSNIILTGDFPGAVLHPVADGVAVIEESGNDVLVRAEAGLEWDALVAWAVDNGLGGIENLSLILGTAGAAPVQNIGAYGCEVRETVEWVEYFDALTGEQRRIAGTDCEFGYRESVFKHALRGRAVVTAVVLRLSRVPRFNVGYGDLSRAVDALGGPSLANVRRAVIDVRRAKLPDPEVTGNAGSFFKNPVVPVAQAEQLRAAYPGMPSYDTSCGVKIPAAWLIEQAGWKGYDGGTVGVHPMQPLVIINRGGATAQEIIALAGRITDDVHRKFGIALSMEVNIL